MDAYRGPSAIGALKKGSGSEPLLIFPNKTECGEVPDPYFNRQLAAIGA